MTPGIMQNCPVKSPPWPHSEIRWLRVEKIAIFVPAFESIWTSLDDHVGHLRRYTIASLGEKLVAAGFEVEWMKYCDSLGFVLAYLYKFFGGASGEPSGTSLKMFDRIVFPVSLAVDKATSRLFGKNVLALARRS
jgi:hypothetical protein